MVVTLRAFFTANRQVSLFIYGQVFFVLGLAIAMQSRRYSRLDLARSLSWLAAFGILHGLHEWGDLFIPLQALYLPSPIIQALEIVYLFLLAGSFTCLFEFGVTLLHPLGRARWLHGFSVGLLLAWILASFFVWLPLAPGPITWRDTANAMARYFIGFPGALLAAYGLRRHALDLIAPLDVPRIVRMLRVAGVMLALYAVFAGLIPPPSTALFPGNVVNTAVFEQLFGVPPLVFRSLVALIMTVAFIRALEVFEVETQRMIEAMEQSQILAAERDRIGRELHDGAIQTVYTAGLLVDSARRLAEPQSPLAARLDKAIEVLQDAIHDLRQSLGELRAAPSGEPLPAALRRLAEDPRFASLVDVALELDLRGADSLSAARTDHVLAIVQEALSNVVRHSRARHVKIEAQHLDGRLHLLVRDDGTGLPRQLEAGYGLRNMRDRARLLGGTLEISDAAGKGTTVSLDIPWNEER